MAKGDFARHIQPKITNNSCQSCGRNDWNLVEEANAEEPFIVARPLAGGFTLPPNGFRSLLLVCNHCHFVRTYLVPYPPDVETPKT